MVVGRLVQGVVKSIDKKRKVVNLSSDAEEVAKCVVCIISFSMVVSYVKVNQCKSFLFFFTDK